MNSFSKIKTNRDRDQRLGLMIKVMLSISAVLGFGILWWWAFNPNAVSEQVGTATVITCSALILASFFCNLEKTL